MSKIYTAQELREESNKVTRYDCYVASDMLRQAADMRERLDELEKPKKAARGNSSSEKSAERFAEALAAERDHIERAKADAEDLEIDCKFCDFEVEAIIDRLDAAHKRDVKELCDCLKAAVDDYFKNQCPRCMGCRSMLRCEYRGWKAVLEKYTKAIEGGER